jgi:hypothetical protein
MKETLNLCMRWRVWFLASLALLPAANVSAQGIYATLTGVVTDPSQAVVISAKVTLKDTQSSPSEPVAPAE